MSALAAVLRKHREELNEEDVCICGHHGDWPAHVAERIAEDLPETDALAALGERFLRASASLMDLELTASHEGNWKSAMRLKAKRSGVELALSYLLEAERAVEVTR